MSGNFYMVDYFRHWKIQPVGQIQPSAYSVYNVSLEYSVTIHLYIVYSCFCATGAELRNCAIYPRAHKV